MTSHLCQLCEVPASFKCALCERSCYCSEKHQIQMWSVHRLHCQDHPVPEFSRPKPLRIQETNYTLFSPQPPPPPPPPPEKSAQVIKRQKTRTKDVIQKGCALKKQMELRDIERANSLRQYLMQNNQSALISCRRVTVNSQRIASQMTQLMIDELQYSFFIRTSKVLQDMEYLMDSLLLMKIFANMDKVEDIKDTVLRLKLPTMSPRPPNPSQKNKQELAAFNIWKQETVKYQCILRSMIQITSIKGIQSVAESLYQKYNQLVSIAYGELELATAYFTTAQWYACESEEPEKQLQNAKKYFTKCLTIREKYGETLALADVLYNLSITEFNINRDNNNNNETPINLLERSLRIKRNIISIPSLKYTPALQLLGRFYMMNGQFMESYEVLFECFKLYKQLLPMGKLDSSEGQKRQKLQILLVFLYKNVAAYISKYQNIPQIKQFQRVNTLLLKNLFECYEQFDNYLIVDEEIVETNFHLKTTEQLFESFSSSEVQEMGIILDQLQQMNFYQGINYFRECNLFKRSDNERKTMFIVANPSLEIKKKINFHAAQDY